MGYWRNFEPLLIFFVLCTAGIFRTVLCRQCLPYTDLPPRAFPSCPELRTPTTSGSSSRRRSSSDARYIWKQEHILSNQQFPLTPFYFLIPKEYSKREFYQKKSHKTKLGHGPLGMTNLFGFYINLGLIYNLLIITFSLFFPALQIF